jgi:hypothetical protein
MKHVLEKELTRYRAAAYKTKGTFRFVDADQAVWLIYGEKSSV